MRAEDELKAIDKELRGNVCDPDPLPQMFPGSASRITTYGLASGLLRERDQLRTRIAELEAENARLKEEVEIATSATVYEAPEGMVFVPEGSIEQAETKLRAAELDNKRLREAIEFTNGRIVEFLKHRDVQKLLFAVGEIRGKNDKALQSPPDLTEIEAMLKDADWISVNDRLPEWPDDETERVLVYSSTHSWMGSQFEILKKVDFYYHDPDMGDDELGTDAAQVVTHWRYIQPPKIDSAIAAMNGEEGE